MSNQQTSPKVVYIALDACDADTMLRLADEGRCPSLALLLDGAAVVDTVAPSGTFTGSSWMTITTGSDVARHGYWNWLEIDPATYQLRETTPRDARGRPFWEHLSDSGRRVAVLDVPHAGLPDSFNGVLLKEWGCHDRHDGTASFPPGLLEELDATVGRHPVGCRDHPGAAEAFSPCDYTLRDGPYRTLDEERQLLDLLRAGVDAKHRASVHVLEQESWDFFGTVLGEAHCVGHQFWHFHHLDHPRHDSARRKLLGNPVEEIYIRLDVVLGDLIDRSDRDANVYVQMNHGMGPHFDGEHLLDELLRRIEGSLDGRFEAGTWSKAGSAMYRRSPRALHGLARRGIAAVARMKARIGPPVPGGRVGPGPDRRFFPIPGNSTVGAVRFNVIGRESGGNVQSGQELDRLIDVLTDALHEIVDIDSGRPLVRSVVRADTVVDKDPDDRLPDLFIEWDRATLAERVWSPTTGTVAVPYAHWRTGDHHDRGLLIARGPGIRPGPRTSTMSLVDVAPTLAAALGIELPDVDGKPNWDLVGRAGVTRVRNDSAAEIAGRFATTEAELVDLRQRVGASEKEHLISNTMAWLAQEPVRDEVLISVITPTHDRPERLAEAIQSVIAQRHRRWEMVIVDDGSNTAAAVVAAFADNRIRLVEAEHGGVCRARNLGLDAATGDVIVYLDDDNWLDPGWLHAVGWAFRTRPEAAVLYGARVFDDFTRTHLQGSGGWPWVQFNPFDREGLEQEMLADMGVIAHRAGHLARFQEDLIECGDWDFFLSLTVDERPLELPVIAFYYRTDGADRLTGMQPGDSEVVRRKWASSSTE